MNREKLEALPKKQFWIEDDDYSKPHTFVELDQAIAALTDEQPQKVDQVLRYHLTVGNFFGKPDLNWAVSEDGEWVKYDDIARRLAEHTPEPNRAVVSRKAIDTAFNQGWSKTIGNYGEKNENEQGAFVAGLDAVFNLQLPAPQPTAETCTWTEDEDGHWDTSCGDRYTFIEGGPGDNGQRFCGYCGKSLKEAKHGQ